MKKFLLVLLIVFIVIQFFRPERNKGISPTPESITVMYPPGDSVKTILQKACNDCHSNNTRYPWYANIQPVAWWLDSHIKDGKKEFNFDDFGNYSLRKQYNRANGTIELVKEGKMPLNSYTWVHTDAKLTQGEKVAIANWASAIMDSMEAKYPIDSLKRKKS